MNLSAAKLFLGFFVLFAFVGIGVFGLLQFNHADHSAEAPMANCPYTGSGYSICQNTLNHINNWQQFSNTIIPSLFAFLLLVSGTLLYFIIGRSIFLFNSDFLRWKHYFNNKKPYTPRETIIEWLSLFENSPSFARARHS